MVADCGDNYNDNGGDTIAAGVDGGAAALAISSLSMKYEHETRARRTEAPLISATCCHISTQVSERIMANHKTRCKTTFDVTLNRPGLH